MQWMVDPWVVGNGAAFVVGLAANLRSALHLRSQAGCVRTDCVRSPPIGVTACPYCHEVRPPVLWGTVMGEAVPVDINVGPACVYLNRVRSDAVPLVLLDRLGELELAEQIILNVNAES